MARDHIQAFRASVAERIVQMNVTWIQLEQGVGDRDIGDGLLRELHTLKGEASLLGFAAISKLAHALEDIVAAVLASSQPPAAETGDLVLRAFDFITSLSEEKPGEPPAEVAPFLDSLLAVARVARASGTVPPGLAEEKAPADVDLQDSTKDERPTIEFSDALLPVVEDKPRASSSYSVKVNPIQLDRMRDIIGELLLARTRLARFAAALHKERNQGAYEPGDPGEQMLEPFEDDEVPGLDHEDVLRSIEGQLRDDVLRMGNLVNALDDITRDLRMVSVSVLFNRYPLAVRSISRELGRQVQLVRRGEAVQADREVLDALEDPLLHLVRNAVDHGIEPPDRRRAMGKSEVGTLDMEASVVGDMLRVKISDDGAGIDVERVRKLAIERNVIDASAARTMSARDVLKCLFAPGMSTRSSITSISGRGIGLDVVYKTVQNLGGSVEIQSGSGIGTTFLLNVPIRASISSVLLFQVGRGWYALPTSALVAIEELDEYPIAASVDGPALRYKEGPLVPLIAMEPILAEPRYDTRHGRRRTRVIIARQGSVTFGLTGSYNHIQREAVLKSASSMFSDDGLISAGLALEDGSVALVLNPGEIFRRSRIRQAGSLGADRQKAESSTGEQTKHTVLVAEDSPIVRDLVVDALRSNGLDVVEAGDGQEALDLLEVHPEIELLVTDVEMPRLTGLGLIAAMRARGGKRIPAIVVSTRGSDADKAAAVEVGADAYLVKSDFSREQLWALVSRFLS